MAMMKTAFGLLAGCALFTSCGIVESPLIPGSQAAAAKDQIMLVRQEPPSFGYQRLVTQAHDFPDLGLFVAKYGVPDFLAETGSRERQYFILYYLRQRHAFACRTRLQTPRTVEFSGPYPITDKEYKLLDGFRSNAARIRIKSQS